MKNISKVTKNNFITYAIVIVAYIVISIMVSTGNVSYLFQGLLVPMCYYIILAVSLNLTVGILGELCLGHAGFMCVGGFVSALFTKLTEESITNDFVRFILALLMGALAAALFGIIIGTSVLRLKGDYLAIVTLAFGEIIKNVVNCIFLVKDSDGYHFSLDVTKLKVKDDAVRIVNGPQGIGSIPKQSTFTIGIILVLLTLVIVLNIINSRQGRAIMAIRDNRIAAESVGINITKFRLLAFTISASLAGVAGVLYSHNLSTFTATPKNFGYNMSITILVMVVLGGIGSIRGSVIASVILLILPEYLRALNDYRMLIYAVVLIVMMVFTSNEKCVEFRKRISSKLRRKN